MNAEIKWLADLDDTASSTVGPKMARLGTLFHMDVPVPEAFVVPVGMFERFFHQDQLGDRIDARLAGIDAGDEAQLEGGVVDVQEWIMETEICLADRDAIAEAYKRLEQCCGKSLPRVAVRSSATKEDSANASFAGQYSTILGVCGADEIFASVCECWASFFTQHAVSYRLQKEISPWSSPMAVGVVELVDAKAAGVSFSIHPVSGKRDRMVVEGSFGWGEAVVQGLVNPDHVEIERAHGRISRILDYQVGDKRVLSTFDASVGRVIEIDMPEDMRDKRVLDDAVVASICELTLRIEAHYDAPADVEWVLDQDDKVIIVQTRPITNIKEQASTATAWDPTAFARRYSLGGNSK